MTDFSLTLNKKGKEINTQDIKGGVKKEQINVKFNSIYDAYDEDGNGVLDDKEMEKFKEAVIKFAKDEEFSKREAGKFLKEKGLKNNADDLFSFLEELTKQTENVEKTEFVKGDGKPDAVVITYKNGSVETLFSDKVTSFAQTDEGGNLITETKNEKGELIKKEVVDPDENKTSTTYTNGKKYIETKNNKDGSVEKTEYDDDENPVHKIVTKGSSEEEYEFTDGEGRIISMISDKGLAIEKKTQFTYNEDGTVTQNITEPGKKSIIIKNGDEIIYESTEQDNVTSEKIKTETGWEDKVTDKDGNITENILNAEGKKTSQAKTVDGQIYNVEYDGNGSTKIVVQNGESPAALARKFGCNEKEILDANRETIGKRNYFLAGENIVIPKEIEADAPALQGRRTKEQAKSAYASDEKQRVAQRLQGKQTKEVIADKDYSSWTQYAKEALAKEGVTNPTQKQIVDRTNELVSLNSGISVPKKGAKIHALKTEAEIEAEKKAEEEKIKQEENAKKESETIQKQSAQQIVNDLKKAINGWNNNDDIKAALNRIDNPNELKEVERLLIAEGYKADELYSPIEKFMYKELSESSVKYNSFDLLESTVQKWIQNGALKGEDAANAQARLSARVICDGGDGFGTDYDKIKRGVHLIKAPAGADKAEAKAVYDKVNQIISKHHTFYGIGSASKDLKDYFKGEIWSSEIEYLDGILAQNNSIQDEQKADAVTALVKEAVGGAGTDIEYLKQAISAVNTPEDRKAVEAKLKEYCEKKDIKPQIQGQNSLQAILYDECDTFAGISTDHKEIRKFNEMLISQGAYTEAEVVNLKAEQAALQILEGDFSNIQNAVQQIKDPKVLAKMNELLEAKGYGNLDDFLSKKVKDQTKMDLINAELAGRNLLDENKSADVAFRLFQNSDYNIRAMGLKAIRTNNTAALVDQKLKESGSSLSDIYSQFNKEKAEYKNKAAVWDGLAYLPIVGGIAEDISDKYRENTDVSDNLYLKSDKPVSISEKQQAAYQMTAATFEQNLEKMKQDYQEALDSQGIVSGVVNAFCSRYNIGTTRDDIEARIEHDTETLRLLKIASEGKLTKLQDGKTVSVSFEDVFKERQSEFITANAISVSGIKNAAAPKETTAFDAEKVAKIANKAEMIAAMDTAKDYISVCWEELNSGLNSNDNKQLSTAIHDTLNKLSQMSGKTLSLPDGYKINNGVIVDAHGNAVSVDKLKELAAQLKTGLSDISKDLLGKEIPQNASNKDVSALLEDGYQSKLESFKAEYREAFGQEVPDKMIESYISTIDNGKMVVNFGVIVGAVIAAPFTGGGSLAVFAAGAGASMTLNAAEKSTDADGYTNSEWTSDATQAMWDGALSTVGVKVGMFANQAAKGGFKMASSVIKAAQKVPGMTPQTLEKIAVGAAKMEAAGGKVAQKVIQANKSRIGKMAPNIKPETLEKAAVWLSRAEAAGMEITSDSLQSVVYSYCTEGEFNEEIFVRGLIMSAAGNTAGHIYGARTDLKSSGNAKPVNNNRPSMDKPKYVIPENESVLAKATRDGNNSQAVAPQRTVGKLNNEKFAQVQKEVDELLSNAKSAADLETLEKQIAALQDRSQRRLLEGKLNAKKAELSKPSAPEVKSEAKVEEAKIKADDVVETPKKNELIDEAKPVEKSNSETPVQNPPAKPASAAVKSKYFSDNDVVSFANEHAMSDAYTHREALLQQGWKRTEADSRNFISVEKDGVLLTYIYDTKTARLMSKSKCLIDIEPNGNYNRKSDIRVEYAADGSRSVKISENGAEIPVNPSALKAEESAAVIQEKSPAAEGAPANGKPVEIPQHNAPEVQHLPNGDTVELTRGADGEIVRRATIRKDGKVTIEENGQIRELDKKGRVIKETKVNADGSQDIITYSYNMFGKQKLASKTRIDAPAGKNKPPVVDIPANPASKLAKSTPVTVANDAVLVLNPGAKQVEIPMSHPKIAAMKDGDMISIGRLKDNNIQINDRYISAQHLVIEKVNGKYVVTDHSINGTKVVSTKGRVANSTPVNDKFKHLNSAENKGKFFYDLYEQNYRDLRLGRYSPEASVKGVPQETINKINAKGRYGGKDYDWMVHDFGKKTNSSGSNIDRVSLNVVADEKMIDELSLLLREGVYTNSSGQKIKLNQNELSSGYFKTPPDVKGWCTRHDPITMYFYGNVSDSMLNALAEVTAKYKRQSTKPLMNALEGKPWIAHEYNPTPQEAHALYQRALKLDKELADMIHFEFNQNKNNPWNTSTGMMASMKQLIDEYEIFLASIRR